LLLLLSFRVIAVRPFSNPAPDQMLRRFAGALPGRDGRRPRPATACPLIGSFNDYIQLIRLGRLDEAAYRPPV